MRWQNHILSDPAHCKGRPCIRGTRVMVSAVLDNLADGESVESILRGFPSINAEDIHACISYAADLTRAESFEIATSV